MKHSHGQNLTPIPFELASLMIVTISSCTRQSPVNRQGRQEIDFHQHMTLNDHFLKKWWWMWQIVWLDKIFVLPRSEKELIFKTGHNHIFIIFMIYLSRCHISSFCNVLFQWIHKGQMSTKLEPIFSVSVEHVYAYFLP